MATAARFTYRFRLSALAHEYYGDEQHRIKEELGKRRIMQGDNQQRSSHSIIIDSPTAAVAFQETRRRRRKLRSETISVIYGYEWTMMVLLLENVLDNKCNYG